MTFDRRSFIGFGSLLACGTVLNAPFLAAAVPRAAVAVALPLCADGEAVLAYVRSYSADFRVLHAPRPGGAGGFHLLAEVADLNHWPEAMARAPFTRIRAGGNTLAFELNGVDVKIENLTPEIFSARVASLG